MTGYSKNEESEQADSSRKTGHGGWSNNIGRIRFLIIHEDRKRTIDVLDDFTSCFEASSSLFCKRISERVAAECVPRIHTPDEYIARVQKSTKFVLPIKTGNELWFQIYTVPAHCAYLTASLVVGAQTVQQ